MSACLLRCILISFFFFPPLVLRGETGESAAADESSSVIPAKAPMVTLELEWEVVENAASYEIKLTPKEGGLETGDAEIRFSSSENRISEKVPVGIYHLQIRSQDKTSGYFGSWSPATEIEVASKTVELLDPVDGAELPSGSEKLETVNFKWLPAQNARQYQLKIWLAEDPSKAREFKARGPELRLKLPRGKAYQWQVTFETKDAIGYRTATQAYSFTLLGPQLSTPVIDSNLGLPHVSDVRWSKSPRSEYYKIRLLRRAIDETEWQPFLENEKTLDRNWSFEKLKPGTYRIEVTAHARNRLSSDTGFKEFTVKPTEEELKSALQKSVVESAETN